MRQWQQDGVTLTGHTGELWGPVAGRHPVCTHQQLGGGGARQLGPARCLVCCLVCCPSAPCSLPTHHLPPTGTRLGADVAWAPSFGPPACLPAPHLLCDPSHPLPSDWVRDVAWAPNFGLPMSTLASAGQDGKVFIWTERQEGVC